MTSSAQPGRQGSRAHLGACCPNVRRADAPRPQRVRSARTPRNPSRIGSGSMLRAGTARAPNVWATDPGHCPRRSGIITLTPALSRAALCYRSGWRRGRGSRVGRSRWNGKSWFASIPLGIREDRREQRWSNGDERPARLPLPACPGLSVPAPGEGRGEGLIPFPGGSVRMRPAAATTALGA